MLICLAVETDSFLWTKTVKTLILKLQVILFCGFREILFLLKQEMIM